MDIKRMRNLAGLNEDLSEGSVGFSMWAEAMKALTPVLGKWKGKVHTAGQDGSKDLFAELEHKSKDLVVKLSPNKRFTVQTVDGKTIVSDSIEKEIVIRAIDNYMGNKDMIVYDLDRMGNVTVYHGSGKTAFMQRDQDRLDFARWIGFNGDEDDFDGAQEYLEKHEGDDFKDPGLFESKLDVEIVKNGKYWDLKVNGKTMIDGESFTIVDQVADYLNGKKSGGTGETREIAKSIEKKFSKIEESIKDVKSPFVTEKDIKINSSIRVEGYGATVVARSNASSKVYLVATEDYKNNRGKIPEGTFVQDITFMVGNKFDTVMYVLGYKYNPEMGYTRNDKQEAERVVAEFENEHIRFTKKQKIEAGFDLTDISAIKWKELLKTIGAQEKGTKTPKGWNWEGDSILIVSANNPITGEYYAPNYREDEKDYASYIGIEGNLEKVQTVVKFIKTNAGYYKEFSNKRNYI